MGSWVVSATSALLLAGLAVCLWVRRPPAPLWPVVFLCQIFALLWVVGDLWATTATTRLEKEIALAMLFTGAVPISVAWWTTARLYIASHGLRRPWMESRVVRWLPPAYVGAAWLFAVTNPWHGQMMTPVVGGPNEHHWGSWLLAHLSYGVVVATFVLCVWATRRHASSDVSRRMAILAVATLAPLLTNLVHVYLRVGPRTDEVAIGLGIGSAAILYGIYRQRLFNPLPIALQEVLRRDPAGVLLLRQGGHLLYWNPAAERLLEGIALEPDLQLLPILESQLAEEHADEGPGELWQTLGRLGGEQEPRIVRYGSGDGGRWLRLSVSPIPTRRGHLAAVCLRVEDVTDLQRIEEQRRELALRLRQLEKLQSLGVMAGGVAHDFNNLLTAIGGYASLSEQCVQDEAALRDNLQQIQEATNLAAALTHQLLASAGRGPMEKEPVALSELAAETVQLVRGAIPSKVRLVTELGADLPAVEADPTQLRQVVMNLVTNAGEAIGDVVGSITVRSRAESADPSDLRREGLEGLVEPGDYVVLEVEDTGCGLDEEMVQQVFDPFFSTKAGGRGLGLAVVFGIVRAHRGAISVHTDKGSGAIFRVWLPVSLREPETADETRHLPEAETWRASGTLLVVDDQERIRRLAARVLEGAGFRVLSAAGGVEAVALVREHAGEIRLVLLDLTMPDMAGDEVLREIRAIDPEVRVLLSSGYDETDAMSRIPSSKVWGFVAKPYRPAELLGRVREALGAETDAP
jgi:PAS domain S-box-containing protein